jgi:hypothetical protein
MAVFAATDYVITINGTAMTTMIQSAELTISTDPLDASAFGSSWKVQQGGGRSGTLSLTFNQDYAASKVDALISAVIMHATTWGTPVAFTIANASSGAITYSGSVLISEYTGVGAKWGDLAQVTVSWPTSGAITRA